MTTLFSINQRVRLILSTLLITLFTSNTVFAHTDHHLTGVSHEVYHVIFWSLFALVVLKIAAKLYQRKKSAKNNGK
jgi:hypothetical protein